MSKAVISYYDWELSFKNKSGKEQNLTEGNLNSLGMSEYNFRDFMAKWKKENLS